MKKQTRNIKYDCSACGQPFPRDELTVKRVVFATMGANFKTIKSRTVAWLCKKCLHRDEAWLQKKLAASPGFADLAEGQDPSGLPALPPHEFTQPERDTRPALA